MTQFINPAFKIKQTVFLVADLDQLPRMVTAYVVSNTDIQYRLVGVDGVSEHNDFEISESETMY
jgi:hypothetical protein